MIHVSAKHPTPEEETMARTKQRREDEGSVLVTGPGCEGRRAPNENAGMSLALHLATRLDRDAAFYVRDADGRVIARVNREGRAYTTTRRPA